MCAFSWCSFEKQVDKMKNDNTVGTWSDDTCSKGETWPRDLALFVTLILPSVFCILTTSSLNLSSWFDASSPQNEMILVILHRLTTSVFGHSEYLRNTCGQ